MRWNLRPEQLHNEIKGNNFPLEGALFIVCNNYFTTSPPTYETISVVFRYSCNAFTACNLHSTLFIADKSTSNPQSKYNKTHKNKSLLEIALLDSFSK
jgi:hypothetical protein